MKNQDVAMRPRPSGNEIVGAVGALLLQLFVAASFSAIVTIFLSMSVTRCTAHACNYTMFGISIYLIPAAEIVVFALSIVLVVISARRDRPLWLPVVLGTVALVIVFVVAALLNNASTQDWGPLG